MTSGSSFLHLLSEAAEVRAEKRHVEVETVILTAPPREESNNFVCSECSIGFKTNEECLQHIRDHDEPKSCPRKGCKSKLTTYLALSIHEKCHLSKQPSGGFACPECPGSSFARWRNCSLHLWTAHKIDAGLLTCQICSDFKTAIPAKLQNHLLIHAEEKSFVCFVCRKGFKQLSQLQNHAAIHLDKDSDKRPNWTKKKQCDICNQIFSDSKCLKKHVQAVHSKLKPYICQVCNHQSARKAMLEMHMRQHTGEKPFQCRLCVYKTADHSSLRRHNQAVHAQEGKNEKPYKCPFCDYSSVQTSSFKRHLLGKHPERADQVVFKCTDCSFISINKASLINHVVLKHRMANSDSKDAEKEEKSVDESDLKLMEMQEEDSATRATKKPVDDEALFSPPSSGSSRKRVKKRKKAPIAAKAATALKSKSNIDFHEEDSLHGTTTDLGGTTIPASE